MEATEKTTPTREQVEALKAEWRYDNDWACNIEDVEGYEAYRDELLAFRLNLERQREEREEANQAAYDAKVLAEFNKTDELGRYRQLVWAMERIGQLEDRIRELEGKCKS